MKKLFIIILSFFILSSSCLYAQSEEEGKKIYNEGLELYSKYDYKGALVKFEEALKIFKKTFYAEGISSTLGNMGMIYSNLGDYKSALKYCNDALEMCRSNVFKDVKGEGKNLVNIGLIYANMGDYKKSLQSYEGAMDIFKRLDDLQGQGKVCVSMGNLYSDLGDYDKALEYYEEGLDVAKRTGDLQGEAINLTNMGSVYEKFGDYIQALTYDNQALEITRKMGYTGGEAKNLANIGNVYNSLGDYQKALEYYNQAIEIKRKMGDAKNEAFDLNNIGDIYYDLSEYDKALECFNKSLKIKKTIGLSADSTLANIGKVYLARGELKKAYELFTSLEHPVYSGICLGKYYLATKEYGEAKASFFNILEDLEKNRDAYVVVSYIGLGMSEEGLKNYKEAEKYYKKAVDFLERQRDSLTQSQRKNFFEGHVEGFSRLAPYEGLVRIYHYLNRDSEGLLYGESTKARLFAEEIARKYEGSDCRLPEEISIKERTIINKIASLYKQMEEAYKNDNKDKIKELTAMLTPLKEEKEKFVSQLRQNYPEYASIMYPKPLKPEEIKLNDEEVIIEYEVTDRETVGWLIKKGQIVKTVTISVTKQSLTGLVREYRSIFEDVKDVAALGKFKPETGKKLYDLLLKPLVSEIKNEKIIIIPDEILGILPFEALICDMLSAVKMVQGKFGPCPEGIKYTGDRYNISYYQSASSLTMMRTLNKGKAIKGLFAIGDPVFNEQDDRLKGTAVTPQKYGFLSLQGLGQGMTEFQRLPQTGELLTGVSAIFPGEITSLSGTEATLTGLKSKNLADYRYLLFATHGILDNDIPYIKEPALVLCLVNNNDDGFLTMSRVMDMKMGADVAVLSACKTGLGKTVSGEGTMGMGRAFQYAGVKNVLMSLWSVETVSTNMMIEKYFECLKPGKSSREALKEARAYIRKEGYGHPFYWAPFILVGD
ncbi:MAG: CHAT domain-containing tetratricopeptide repeat protein [Candidatus Eremiobacterota bacterium]